MVENASFEVKVSKVSQFVICSVQLQHDTETVPCNDFVLQELIQLIKQSKIPVVCMCNDRNHPKIRSLSNYCYDLRFQRPRLEQIKVRVSASCLLFSFVFAS